MTIENIVVKIVEALIFGFGAGIGWALAQWVLSL